MPKYTMSFDVMSIPECPICRDQLVPAACSFMYSTAICHSCFQTLPEDFASDFYRAIVHPRLSGHFSTSHGLRFFTPKNHIGGSTGLLSLYNMIACHSS